jgi:hypothetical protein
MAAGCLPPFASFGLFQLEPQALMGTAEVVPDTPPLKVGLEFGGELGRRPRSPSKSRQTLAPGQVNPFNERGVDSASEAQALEGGLHDLPPRNWSSFGGGAGQGETGMEPAFCFLKCALLKQLQFAGVRRVMFWYESFKRKSPPMLPSAGSLKQRPGRHWYVSRSVTYFCHPPDTSSGPDEHETHSK